MSDPVANVRYAASVTGGAIGSDQQGIFDENNRGTPWYGWVCCSYVSS
jgi:hypothetical protein